MRVRYHQLTIATGPGIQAHDITPAIRAMLTQCGMWSGFVTVTSRHTTTAITINENEPRLIEDLRRFLGELAPAGRGYLHDDIHLRDCPPDEPRNAHAHLLAMLLGSSEVLPVVEGKLDLGTWQSVLLIDLDGPRARNISIQVCGE
jgi:secondary thiamine-phosphate synthase enzyme